MLFCCETPELLCDVPHECEQKMAEHSTVPSKIPNDEQLLKQVSRRMFCYLLGLKE